MLNDSVIKAYSKIDALTKMVEKAETDGIPKNMKMKQKKSAKKGLLTRSDEMFKYTKGSRKEDEVNIEQQKLVTAYVLHIRKAFEEVKNGRATDIKS